MTGRVALVIVSQSAEVARGTVEMVRQMVGHEVPIAHSGGNPPVGWHRCRLDPRRHQDGLVAQGRGHTSRSRRAETNSEMAIEMLPESWRDKVVICNAPIVEGAVMAATEAAGGGSLEQVRATAEELAP
jgi:dihydroxyacetone kinase DhaKLM complex PTS-EIIA-like component DhaM